MDVCKLIVPLRHEGTLNSRRAASLFVRLMEGVERRSSNPDIPKVVYIDPKESTPAEEQIGDPVNGESTIGALI
ncbi:hypothetical protein TNCV_3148591 [Trichonephila clavipes]|nr:hypothetical protein TNCV_3148591 [Trichonephila clavipes]